MLTPLQPSTSAPSPLSPRVQGILSFPVVPGSDIVSLSLRHYLVLSSVDLRACNAGFDCSGGGHAARNQEGESASDERMNGEGE